MSLAFAFWDDQYLQVGLLRVVRLFKNKKDLKIRSLQSGKTELASFGQSPLGRLNFTT